MVRVTNNKPGVAQVNNEKIKRGEVLWRHADCASIATTAVCSLRSQSFMGDGSFWDIFGCSIHLEYFAVVIWRAIFPLCEWPQDYGIVQCENSCLLSTLVWKGFLRKYFCGYLDSQKWRTFFLSKTSFSLFSWVTEACRLSLMQHVIIILDKLGTGSYFVFILFYVIVVGAKIWTSMWKKASIMQIKILKGGHGVKTEGLGSIGVYSRYWDFPSLSSCLILAMFFSLRTWCAVPIWEPFC